MGSVLGHPLFRETTIVVAVQARSNMGVSDASANLGVMRATTDISGIAYGDEYNVLAGICHKL